MKKVILLSALSLSLALVACNKDEDCGHKTYEEYMLAPTDLETSGLFGKVKTFTMIIWNNCTWENNAVVTGGIEDKYVRTFNEAGYLISYKNWDTYSGTNGELRLSLYYEQTYDSKNRVLTYEELDEDGEAYYREACAYNDTDKTATITFYSLSDGEWIAYRTAVCQLNKYGRMDDGNVEYFYGDETRSDKYVTKYDSHGNRSEDYNIYNGNVWHYYTYSYEYYK